MISKELLEILACPECHAPVLQDGGALQCSGPECRRRYPVRDDIPIMLVSESEALETGEWERRMKAARESAGEQ